MKFVERFGMRFAQQWVDFNGHNFADMKMQNLLSYCCETVLSNGKTVPAL